MVLRCPWFGSGAAGLLRNAAMPLADRVGIKLGHLLLAKLRQDKSL
jgi:hypothetical protein